MITAEYTPMAHIRQWRSKRQAEYRLEFLRLSFLSHLSREEKRSELLLPVLAQDYYRIEYNTRETQVNRGGVCVARFTSL
jgi:hypothetical protein